MSTTPTQALSSRPLPGRWARISGAGAVACALSPLLQLLSIAPWSRTISWGPIAAIVLASTTLWATRRSRARRPRQMAGLAIAIVCTWVLLLFMLALELRYG